MKATPWLREEAQGGDTSEPLGQPTLLLWRSQETLLPGLEATAAQRSSCVFAALIFIF